MVATRKLGHFRIQPWFLHPFSRPVISLLFLSPLPSSPFVHRRCKGGRSLLSFSGQLLVGPLFHLRALFSFSFFWTVDQSTSLLPQPLHLNTLSPYLTSTSSTERCCVPTHRVNTSTGWFTNVAETTTQLLLPADRRPDPDRPRTHGPILQTSITALISTPRRPSKRPRWPSHARCDEPVQ